MIRIDLNCDLGEDPESIRSGAQEALIEHVTSVNIACGGHAGDPDTMRATILQALARGVGIGAHPGYADREDFGRAALSLPPADIAASVHEQVRALARIAGECGASIAHVKPHGALYNQAARDPEIAGAIARGVALWGRDVVLVGLAGSVMLDVFREAGFAAAAEAFADRRYEAGGGLRSRSFPDALISEPAEAAAQAVRLATAAFRPDTLCIHSDTPGAATIAAAVAAALLRAGILLAPMGRNL